LPIRWKSQKLVLLPKGKDPAHAVNSYRPLCVLDIIENCSNVSCILE